MIPRHQMELVFDNSHLLPKPGHRARRLRSAAWWFEQMHRAVDRATPWGKPAFVPRPHQDSLSLPPANE